MPETADVVAYLRRIADDELYRRNAFRVTGLPTDAGPRAVRERQKKDAARASVGVPFASDPRLPLPAPPTDEEVRAAYDVLADPRRRLVHELFWFWGEDVTACGCAPETHERHDTAVGSHAEVLDLELAGQTVDWSVVRDDWDVFLEDDDPRGHLLARLEVLDDVRLDAAAPEALTEEIPRALVATILARAVAGHAPGRLREEAECWLLDADVLDDLVVEAVGDRVAAIEARLAEARELLDTTPLTAAQRLRPGTVAELGHLEALAPHHRFRSLAALREDAAVVLNNAALRVVGRRRPGELAEALDVLADAEALATSTATRDTIARNQVEAREVRRATSVPAPGPSPAGSRPATAPDRPASRRRRGLRNGPAVVLGLAIAGGVIGLAVAVVTNPRDAQGVLAVGIVIGTLLGIALVAVLAVGTVIGTAAGVSAAVAAGARRCVGWWSRRRPGRDTARDTARQRAVGWSAAAVVPLLAGAVAVGVFTGSPVLVVIMLVAALLVGVTVALLVTS
ncbi:hypothetical protein [Actinomycetospora aeridis]|uniref:J domain-containing protein n=1 Tax=Actinomycetospora aeridis TaxID=3129231 RepID=A0ABU8N176_9PSEU